jgi:DNA-binding IclR family transcriptional regulator
VAIHSVSRAIARSAERDRAGLLAPRLIPLARSAEPLVELADPVMRGLVGAGGETVIFVRLVAGIPVCVHRVESPHCLRATFEPGQPLPLLRGASGRVLLAGLPDRARREHLAPLAQANPEAAARLEQEIAKVAVRGWATSEEEIEPGIWAASAGVTDGRTTVGALTVPSPLVRASATLQERLLGQVRAAAGRLSGLILESQ